MIGAGIKSEVRRPKVGDADALAQIFVESWRQAYVGIIPHIHLECMILRRGAQWWKESIKTDSGLFVIDVAGDIAGYATCGAARRGGAYRGEIYELYLAPLYQGLGLGEHMFEACRSQLDRRALKGLIVWALADNTMAADFYWRRGGRAVARTFERFGTTKLNKIGYGWD